jgi:hypothetical protein
VGVQLTVLGNIQDDGWADFDRLSGLQPIWDMEIHEHGQLRTVDGETRGENWQLLVRPTAWAQLYVYNEKGRQFGYFSKTLLENINWHHNPEAGDLALALLRFCRYQSGRPKGLTVQAMLEVCHLNSPSGKHERSRNRHKLENAILQQQDWGWTLRWERWPEKHRPTCESRSRMPRGYWETWQDWKVVFVPPEDLSRANNVKGLKEDRRAGLPGKKRKPKGWPPERITALIEHAQQKTHWSQKHIAEEWLGVSSSYVSKWKSGNRSPSKKHGRKLRMLAKEVCFEG